MRTGHGDHTMTTTRCEICEKPLTVEDGILPRCPFCGYDPTDQDPDLDGEFTMGDLLAGPYTEHDGRLLYVQDLWVDADGRPATFRVNWPHVPGSLRWIDADRLRRFGWRLATTAEIQHEIDRMTRERNAS